MMLCSICEWLASSVEPFWAKPVPYINIYYKKGGWLFLIVRQVMMLSSICEWLASSVEPFWAKPVPHINIYYKKGGWLFLIVRQVMMLCSICEWLASSVEPFWAKPIPHSIYYKKGGWLLLIVRPVIKCSICGSSQVLRATDKMYRKSVVVVVVVVGLYSVLSNIRTGPTDANAFRGHRLTTQKGYTHRK